MTNSFGFLKPDELSKKLDTSGFKPLEKKPEASDDAKLDALAETVGFVSREPIERVEKVRKKKAVQDTVYVRADLEVTNRFKEYCNENNMSYGEGLAYLMKNIRKRAK